MASRPVSGYQTGPWWAARIARAGAQGGSVTVSRTRCRGPAGGRGVREDLGEDDALGLRQGWAHLCWARRGLRASRYLGSRGQGRSGPAANRTVSLSKLHSSGRGCPGAGPLRPWCTMPRGWPSPGRAGDQGRPVFRGAAPAGGSDRLEAGGWEVILGALPGPEFPDARVWT